MRMNLSEHLRERLAEYCRSKLPEEACGFIAGVNNGNTLTALDFIPVSNVAADRRKRFDMNPVELTEVLYRIPQEQLLGVFHSHPSSPAVPSEHDMNTVWHTLPTYWIVSMRDADNPDIAIYNKKDFSVVREVFVNDG